MRKKNLADTKFSEEGGGGCSRCQSRSSPAVCRGAHVGVGCPLKRMMYCGRTDFHNVACEDANSGTGGSDLKEAASHGEPSWEQTPELCPVHKEEPAVEQEVWQELPLVWDSYWNSLFLDRPHGTNPYRSSSSRTVAFWKPMQERFRSLVATLFP